MNIDESVKMRIEEKQKELEMERINKEKESYNLQKKSKEKAELFHKYIHDKIVETIVKTGNYVVHDSFTGHFAGSDSETRKLNDYIEGYTPPIELHDTMIRFLFKASYDTIRCHRFLREDTLTAYTNISKSEYFDSFFLYFDSLIKADNISVNWAFTDRKKNYQYVNTHDFNTDIVFQIAGKSVPRFNQYFDYPYVEYLIEYKYSK